MARSEVITVDVAGEPVRVTSPGKVLFPEQGWTKMDLVSHFIGCADGALRGVYGLSLIHISEPTDRTRSRMPSSA